MRLRFPVNRRVESLLACKAFERPIMYGKSWLSYLSLMHNNQETGRIGERLAGRYLESIGLSLLFRNYRCRIGEVDIVALDAQTLVFCEVKTRTTLRFGVPAASVHRAKLQRLRRMADYFLIAEAPKLSGTCRLSELNLRIDVISVLFGPDHEPEIEHFRNVSV